ncbi:MAG: hydroxymethylglutaryl-CoA synthase family protein [Halioglobus sp.]|nr:hydroxymethylglutaryl-CoA synthase family protein [Halioglobus sp.]
MGASEQSVGIVACGCYIPSTRLPLAMIQGGKAREGGAEKAVAAFDEDAITMAVAAAVECLTGQDRSDVDGVYLATTSSPFREKQAAAFVAKALDLRSDVATADFTGTLRAAAGAFSAACDAVRVDPARRILLIAADTRLPAPRSSLEMHTGDAAAAFLIGAGEVHARIKEIFTHSDEIYDVWRSEHDDYLRTWEDRFNVMHGYSDNVLAACQRMFDKTGTRAGDYGKAVLAGPDARSVFSVAKQIGFGEQRLQDALFGKVGNCGVAFAPLLLVSALESSAPGDRLLIVFYGDGAAAMTLEVLAPIQSTRGLGWHLDRGTSLRSYDSYLKSRHLDATEHNRRGGEGVPATVHYRERDDDISFYGQRCKSCGTVHFPACRVCYVCHAKDSFEAVRLSDRHGRVMSYSFDYFFPSPEPPVIVGVCEVDNGARVYVQMTDASIDQLHCDMPIEFVFRKIHDAGNKPNYFWKSRPLNGSATEVAA